MTLGPEVGDFCESVGFGPYPEQRLLLDDTFAVGRSGVSAAFEVDVIAARQQMKTGYLKMCALAWLYVLPQDLVVWSAHEFDTCREAFHDLRLIIDGSDYLGSKVLKVTTGAGSEAIEMRNGSRLKFKARTSGGGVGLTGSKVILDEGWALQPEHLGALIPTLTMVPDPQVVIVSSACRAASSHLRRVVKDGRAGTSARRAYFEWAAPRRDCGHAKCLHDVGADGCALDDRELWARSCVVSARKDPTLEVIASLRDSMPPDKFMREILVWHDEPTGEALFSTDALDGCLDEDSRIESGHTFALDVSPSQSHAAIVVAGSREDGLAHLEVTSRDGVSDWREGLEWVVPRLVELSQSRRDFAVWVVTGSPAMALAPGLTAAGVTVCQLAAGDVPAACGKLYAEVSGRSLRHVGQPELVDGLGRTRKTADETESAWRFGRRRSDGDITVAYAAAVALLVARRDHDYDVLDSIG